MKVKNQPTQTAISSVWSHYPSPSLSSPPGFGIPRSTRLIALLPLSRGFSSGKHVPICAPVAHVSIPLLPDILFLLATSFLSPRSRVMDERPDPTLIFFTAALIVVHEVCRPSRWSRVDPVHSAPSPAPQHTTESSRGKRRKRVAEEESFVGDGIESKIEHLTTAIDKYVDKAIPLHLDDKKIFKAVMEMAAHGTFLKDDLFDVYCHLVDNERDARKFMGGNTEFRLKWLTRHLLDHGLSRATNDFGFGSI